MVKVRFRNVSCPDSLAVEFLIVAQKTLDRLQVRALFCMFFLPFFPFLGELKDRKRVKPEKSTPRSSESARGRAVQGAALRLQSRERRGFEPHRTHFFAVFSIFVFPVSIQIGCFFYGIYNVW